MWRRPGRRAAPPHDMTPNWRNGVICFDRKRLRCERESLNLRLVVRVQSYKMGPFKAFTLLNLTVSRRFPVFASSPRDIIPRQKSFGIVRKSLPSKGDKGIAFDHQ